MKRVAVINLVGLSQDLLELDFPFLKQWLNNKSISTIEPALPAVTCTAQTNYLTGESPEKHGIVANGWKFREEEEIKLWRQSNKLVQSPSLWEEAREKNPDFTVANMFWWYNMYSSVDFSVTPRPQYYADGRKAPDCYSHPSSLRDHLQNKLGTFPLFSFWGPRANIRSTDWIAEAAMEVDRLHSPTLNLIYLPHMDYCLQKFGPGSSKVQKEALELDAVCEKLITYLEKQDIEPILLSEYGITPVDTPIHLNREFKKKGWLTTRKERNTELPDIGASKVFAMADHQLAHIYVAEPGLIEETRNLVSKLPGVSRVLTKSEQTNLGINHERSGELVAISDPNAWFTYYYWLDDKMAPDFARTVDIHRKPGYDPVELFDKGGAFLPLTVIRKLIAKKLGFRTLMNLIPLDANLVKGSHGSHEVDVKYHPLIASSMVGTKNLRSTDIKQLIMNHIFAVS